MRGVRKLAGVAAGTALVALAAAGAADARTETIGEDVNNIAGVVTTNDCLLPCTWMNTKVPLGAPTRKLASSPCNGTVTTWRVNAATGGDSVKLRVIRDENGAGT